MRSSACRSAAFHPRPAVDSMVVELRPLPEPRVAAAATPLFSSVVRAAFQQRRKTLANAPRRGRIRPGPRAALEEQPESTPVAGPKR